MNVPIQRVRSTPHLQRWLAVLAVLAFAAGELTFATPAQAYTWQPWRPYVYVSMETTQECTMATRAKNQFIGPLTSFQQNLGCRHAIRMRRANTIVGAAAPWVDIPIQLQDTGGWGMYGMTLTTVVRYNGSVAHGNTPTCSHYAYFISFNQTRCDVLENDTWVARLALDYELSWAVEGFGLTRTRGAQQQIRGDGYIFAPTYYHG